MLEIRKSTWVISYISILEVDTVLGMPLFLKIAEATSKLCEEDNFFFTHHFLQISNCPGAVIAA